MELGESNITQLKYRAIMITPAHSICSLLCGHWEDSQAFLEVHWGHVTILTDGLWGKVVCVTSSGCLLGALVSFPHFLFHQCCSH